MHKNGIFFDLVLTVSPLDLPPKFTPPPEPPPWRSVHWRTLVLNQCFKY